MVDTQTRKLLEGIVKTYCHPDMIHETLACFEGQAEKVEGKKKIFCDAFVEGIRRSLGKVS